MAISLKRPKRASSPSRTAADPRLTRFEADPARRLAAPRRAGGLPAAHLPSGLAPGARFPAGVPAAIRSAAAPVASRPGPGNGCPVVAAAAGSPLRAPVPVPARARVRLARPAEGRGAAATGRAVVKQSGPYGGDQQLEKLTKAVKKHFIYFQFNLRKVSVSASAASQPRSGTSSSEAIWDRCYRLQSSKL